MGQGENTNPDQDNIKVSYLFVMISSAYFLFLQTIIMK
jgi:hypothetical protein